MNGHPVAPQAPATGNPAFPGAQCSKLLNYLGSRARSASPMHLTIAPFLRADYRQSVSLQYVKQGFQLLFATVPFLLAVPLAGFALLELLNLHSQGELVKLWQVARQTELTVDLVRSAADRSSQSCNIALLAQQQLQSRTLLNADAQMCRGLLDMQP